MNKIFLKWITVISVFLIQTSNLVAQQAAKTTATGDDRVYENIAGQTSATTTSTGSVKSAIHPKAIRQFSHQYRTTDNADWSRSGKLYVATFAKNDSKTRVVYDRKGNRLYAITEYGEHELPKEVRTIVKSSYFDYNIITVRELQEREVTVYFVYLEDKSTMKIVTVVNGEMNTFQTLIKSQ